MIRSSLSDMGSLFSLILSINIVFFFLSSSSSIEFVGAHEIKAAARVLDQVLGDYALRSYTKLHKTGSLYAVQLPANLSGVRADMVRFRCGSLRRYGAKVKEFHLGTGITVQPCMERVVLVRQNLGLNWSEIYYGNYNISGYQLVSHILGLLAYDATRYLNSTNLSEVGIFAEKEPVTIDFSNVTRMIKNSNTRPPLCASFGSDGKVSIYDQVTSNICLAARHGHFGLVIDVTSSSGLTSSKPVKASEWKIIIGSSIGGAIGVFLLGLLFVALIVKAKKRSQMAEMERKAYEEEALQISMVGHVRMPVAAATRTQPCLEHEYNSMISL